MKTKILEKGYTLRITSWENDADNYRTKNYTTPDRATAKEVKRFCDRFLGRASKGGLGNTIDLTQADKERILHDIKKFPILFPPEDYKDENKHNIIYHVTDLAMELTGPSEFYTFRIVEKVEILYSEEEVFAEEVIL